MRVGQAADVHSLFLIVVSSLFALFAFPARRCGCTRAACRACFRSNGCCPASDYDTRDW